MSGQDLMLDLQEKLQLINTAINRLVKDGKAKAEAERVYRVELAKGMLIERNKGTPVSITGDLVRGDPRIAQLKFDRDVAEVVYNTDLEAIMAWKMETKMLDAQIAREWSR